MGSAWRLSLRSFGLLLVAVLVLLLLAGLRSSDEDGDAHGTSEFVEVEEELGGKEAAEKELRTHGLLRSNGGPFLFSSTCAFQSG